VFHVTALDVAAISAAAAVVAPITSAISLRTSKRLDREIARDARLHQDLQITYSDFLEKLYEMQEAMQRMRPRLPAEAAGLPHALRPFLTDESVASWRRRAAITSTIGSEEVATRLSAVMDRLTDFNDALGRAEQTVGGERAELEAGLQPHRDAFNASVEALERSIRADVRR
jgi:hypothetical protein